jgi:hypothetical protein
MYYGSNSEKHAKGCSYLNIINALHFPPVEPCLFLKVDVTSSHCSLNPSLNHEIASLQTVQVLSSQMPMQFIFLYQSQLSKTEIHPVVLLLEKYYFSSDYKNTYS